MLQGKGLRVLWVNRLIRLESTETALPFRNRLAARCCEADSSLLKGLDTGRGPVGNVVLRFILSVILHPKPLPICNGTGRTCFARAPAPPRLTLCALAARASHGHTRPPSRRVRPTPRASHRPRPRLMPPASCLAPRAAHASCCAPPCRVN
jgi:hypothetical protein